MILLRLLDDVLKQFSLYSRTIPLFFLHGGIHILSSLDARTLSLMIRLSLVAFVEMFLETKVLLLTQILRYLFLLEDTIDGFGK